MTLDRTPASGAGDRIRSSRSEEALGVAEATHPPEHGGARVLEGEVEVGHDARGVGDGLDQPGSGLGGLEVGHPHPLDAVDAGELGQQGLEEPQVAEVLAVGRGVLADEEQLLDALRGEPLALLQHVARTAADEGAAEGRDRAEGAAPVAAARQLERRHRAGVEATAYGAGAGRGRARTDVGGVGGRGPGVSRDRHRRGVPVDRRDRQQAAAVGRRVRVVHLACDDRSQLGGDVGVVVEAEDRVGLGQRLGQVLAIALGEAAHGDDGLGPAAVLHLQVRRLEQGVDGVLLGRLDEAAGVDQDRVGVLRIGDQHEPARLEASGQLLGVDLVARAAERDDRDLERRRGLDGGGLGFGGGHRTVSMPVGRAGTCNAGVVSGLTRRLETPSTDHGATLAVVGGLP